MTSMLIVYRVSLKSHAYVSCMYPLETFLNNVFARRQHRISRYLSEVCVCLGYCAAGPGDFYARQPAFIR
jgi:hypothetical protein